MQLKVGKTFDRLGRRYRRGDEPPPDLDKPTVQHYLRHGMLVEEQPATPGSTVRAAVQRAPARAAPQNARSARPALAEAAGPMDAQQAAPSDTSAPANAPEGT